MIPRSASRSRDARHEQSDDLAQLRLVERPEDDDLVDPVQELGAEVLAQLLPDALGGALERIGPGLGGLDERRRADVAGHDHDRVLEVDRPALRVGQAAVVEQLEQDVEHVGVRLLDLVEEHDLVRPAPDRLGQLPALVVADVAGWGADQARDAELLHVLAHVDPHQRPLVVEEELGEGAGQLRLADAGGAQEDE